MKGQTLERTTSGDAAISTAAETETGAIVVRWKRL